MKTPLLLLLVAAAGQAAEPIRRDLVLAVELADPAFDYRIDTALGSYEGVDACTSDTTLRLGSRWALARPGWSLAPLVGGDLLAREAPLEGGGLSAWGGAATAGLTWACLDRLSLDAEGWGAWTRSALRLDTPAGGSLAGSGDTFAWGGRLRLSWSPGRHWSLGLEAGWRLSSTAIAADGDRDITLDTSGWTAGLILAWRPTVRPTGLE